MTSSGISRKYSPGYIDQRFLTRRVSLDFGGSRNIVCVCVCVYIFLQREPITFRIFSKESMIQRHFKKPLF